MYESMVIYVKVFVILGMNFNGRMNYGFDKNEYQRYCIVNFIVVRCMIWVCFMYVIILFDIRYIEILVMQFIVVMMLKSNCVLFKFFKC